MSLHPYQRQSLQVRRASAADASAPAACGAATPLLRALHIPQVPSSRRAARSTPAPRPLVRNCCTPLIPNPATPPVHAGAREDARRLQGPLLAPPHAGERPGHMVQPRLPQGLAAGGRAAAAGADAVSGFEGARARRAPCRHAERRLRSCSRRSSFASWLLLYKFALSESQELIYV